jgi:hypothetical protein
MSFEFFNQIVGEKLSAVVFVLDYHQLQFDGPSFTILNPITVVSNGFSVAVGENQFRNRLCEQIAKIVKDVMCRESDSLVIEFEDGSRISVSLKSDDYIEPEAIIFRGNDNLLAVI